MTRFEKELMQMPAVDLLKKFDDLCCRLYQESYFKSSGPTKISGVLYSSCFKVLLMRLDHDRISK